MPVRPEDTGGTGKVAQSRPAPTPVQPQPPPDTITAVSTVEKAVGASIPTDITLNLASLGLTEPDVRKAARIAARYYDITPQAMFGGPKKLHQFTSSVTDGPVRMSEFRRLIDGIEPVMMGRIFSSALASYDTKGGRRRQAEPAGAARASKFLEVLGRAFKGEDLSATDGIGLAVSLANDPNLDQKRLDKNLATIQAWAEQQHILGMNWQRRLGIALQATRASITLNSTADVVRLMNPDLAAIDAGEMGNLERLGLTKATANRVVEYWAKRGEALRAGQEPPAPPAGLGPNELAAIADLPAHASLMRMETFRGTTQDYFQLANDLKDEIVMQQEMWANNPINKYLVTPAFKLLDKTNRAFEMAGMTARYALGNANAPSNPITTAMNLQAVAAGLKNGEFTQDFVMQGAAYSLDQYRQDVTAAWHGKAMLADTLVRDWGVPRWQAIGIEFVVGWFLDPLVVGGKAARTFALRTVNPDVLQALGRGIASDKKVLNYVERAGEFSSDNASKLTAAMFSSEDDVIRWSRSFRAVMGDTPFDLPYLFKARRTLLERFPDGMSEAAVREVEGVLNAHFLGKPVAGSVADISTIARNEMERSALHNWQSNIGDSQAYMRYLDSQRELAVVDNIDILPHRLELPKRNYPVPGWGLNKYAGEVYSRTVGDTMLGSEFSKWLNINPGGVLKIHENPQRWFKLSARRAGMLDSEVVNWEARVVSAASGPNPEATIKSLLDEFHGTVWNNLTSPWGMSETASKDLLDSLLADHAALTQSSRQFGAFNDIGHLDDGTPYVQRVTDPNGMGPEVPPLGSAQLVNELPAIDPVIMRRAVTEYVGTVRRMRAIFRRDVLGLGVKELDTAALFPLSSWLEDLVRPVGRAVIKTFKFTHVARPAYMFRVVLGDELLRAFATTQSAWEHALSYGFHAGALAEAPGPLGALARTVAGKGERQIADEVIGGPASVVYEPLANSTMSSRDLLMDNVTIARRRAAAMEATGSWRILFADSPLHLDAWKNALNLQLRQSPGLFRALEAISTGTVRDLEGLKNLLKNWATTRLGKAELRRIGWADKVDEWVDSASSQVWGYTMAGDRNLATNAMLGSVSEDMLRAFPESIVVDGVKKYARPAVNGPELARIAKNKSGLGGLGWFTDHWYGLTVRGPENILNRQPYYRTFKQRADAAYTRMLTTNGVEITPELRTLIDNASRRFSLANSKKIMFDFTEDTRLGEALGFAFPFMQPWAENFSVWGHILTQRNPAMFGYINQLARLGVQSGFIRKDPDTGEYVIPETWFMFAAPMMWAVSGGWKGLFGGGAGGRWSVTTPITSLNLFASSTLNVGGFPIPAPSAGPWLQFGLQQLGKNSNLPWWAHQYLFQYGPGAHDIPELAWETLLPRPAVTLARAFLPQIFGDEQLNSIGIEMLRMQQALGQEPNVDHATSQAKGVMAFLTFTQLFFPGAVRIEYPHDYLNRIYQDKADEFGGGPVGYEKAREWFHTNYPQYDLITIPKTMSAKISNYIDANGNPYLTLFGQTEQAPPGSRLPSTRSFAELMKTPAFRDFANNPETAMWVGGLIAGYGSPKADQFDMTTYFQQLANGDVRQRSIQEVYESHKEAQFFDIWQGVDRAFDATYARLSAQGLDSNDEAWKEVTIQRAMDLQQLGQQYPTADAKYLVPRAGGGMQFIYESGDQWPEGVHPQILESAYIAAGSPVTEGFPAFDGLRAYLDLRGEFKTKLQNRGFSGMESAGAENLKAQWTTQRDALLEANPAFRDTFWSLWFEKDLGYGVISKGREMLNKMQERDRLADTDNYSRYVDFTSTLDSFTTRVTELQNTSGTSADISSVYQEKTHYLNQMYKENPKFIDIWLKDHSAAELNQYVEGNYTSPVTFWTRLDWHLSGGLDMTNRVASWAEELQTKGLHIQKWTERTDGSESSAPLHEDINKWVRQRLSLEAAKAAGIKGVTQKDIDQFRKVIAAQNTWGYGAVAKGYVSVKDGEFVANAPGQAGKAWAAILNYANAMRVAAESANPPIRGDDARVEYSRENRTWWNNQRDNVKNYLDVLLRWSPDFKAQWEQLGGSYSSEGKLYWLIPHVYFKLGEVSK